MSTPGSMGMAMSIVGFTIMLLSVSAGIHFAAGGFFGLLLCFTGVLAGSIVVAFGVRMADHPAPTVPAVVFDGARAVAVLVRRNAAVMGLVVASCAVTAVSGEAAGPVLCIAMFAVLLLGVSLINIGASSW